MLAFRLRNVDSVHGSLIQLRINVRLVNERSINAHWIRNIRFSSHSLSLIFYDTFFKKKMDESQKNLLQFPKEGKPRNWNARLLRISIQNSTSYISRIDRDKIARRRRGVGIPKRTPFFPSALLYVYSDDGVAAGLPNAGTMATTARSMYAVHKSPNNGRCVCARCAYVIGPCIAQPLAKYVINRRAKH